MFKLEEFPAQPGRIAIVTGANVGLGFETSIGLAKKQLKVIMACRNLEKAEAAKSDILLHVPNADLEVIQLDLGSLKSVRRFVETFSNRHDRLDLLINNAGIMIPPFSKTEDGFESQMGVNYFGHFLLTNLLFPLLNKTANARIVSLSSKAHENAKIDFDNLNAENGYSKYKAYGQSKLACIMFSIELQRRLEASGSTVISVAAHPGVSNTNLGRHIPKIAMFLLYPIFSLVIHPPKNAAMPTLQAALAHDTKGGDYFGPTGFNGMKGKPGKVEAKPQAFDKQVAKKLWEVSEELTGEKFAV